MAEDCKRVNPGDGAAKGQEPTRCQEFLMGSYAVGVLILSMNNRQFLQGLFEECQRSGYSCAPSFTASS